jgi:hypothetical protein
MLGLEKEYLHPMLPPLLQLRIDTIIKTQTYIFP